MTIRILMFLGIFLLLFKQVSAQEVKNNKFGIGLAQPHLEDLRNAKEMVNSNGGDWGYVTLVIQENDRDKGKWQEIFDKLREYHLIPIVRLATVPEGAKWKKPSPEDASSWAEFLNSLNWVIKDRYVVLFNEPNHGAEWGGKTDPADYANVAFEFAQKLKEKNPDFFIMLAGMDASAPHSGPDYEDEAAYLQQVFSSETIERWNNVLSGLASHSYPNPGFVGSPSGAGRGSVRTYQWELQLLSSLGIKDLPVFITETGWDRNRLGESTVAHNFNSVFNNVWLNDERVVAVTPFVLDYQGEPFLNFSWKKFQKNEFYQQFYTIQSLEKTKGKPIQIEKGGISLDLPKDLVAHSNYHFKIKLRNSGQALWDKEFGYQLSVVSEQQKLFEYFFSDLKKIKPSEEADIDFFVKTNSSLGKKSLSIELIKDDISILKSEHWDMEIFPLPSFYFSIKQFPFLKVDGEDFEIQVFNLKDELVFKKKKVNVKNRRGVIEEVQNIVLGEKYRVVILKPFYLPKQEFIVFKKVKNNILFETMIPLDFNKDGTLDFNDLGELSKNPALLRNFFPF